MPGDPSLAASPAPAPAHSDPAHTVKGPPRGPARILSRAHPRAMSPTDLLSLVFAGRSAAEAARSLMRKHGLTGLRERSLRDLVREDGLGRSRALRCVAVFEIARRLYQTDPPEDRIRLTSPREVAHTVRDLARLRKEHLVGLYLDAQNFLVHRETLSMGSLNITRTQMREILGPGIQHFAAGVILVHNHPSGIPEPSLEDVEFTRAAARAAELMGIDLYDHVIVASAGHVSLRERGVL